ncbi:hypothetical protein METHP14_70022 [Pseudomonas sp. P14-2025]
MKRSLNANFNTLIYQYIHDKH